MKLETFFEKFDQLADAPNAISAMRELVLQLAVRGNLTERIGGESSKAQLALADAFRVRRAKREEPDAEDVPFPIPENWGWVAVGDSMDMFNGRAFKPEEWSTEGTPIIRIQNLNNERAAFNRCKANLDPKIHVHDGDFLISWSGTPGTSFGAFIWNRGFAYLNQHIFRCELVKGVFEKAFLRLAINARLDEMISHAQGAVGLRHITKGKLESIRLPLPPLAEQKRIVAKLDELMALCDRLESQQQERKTQHAALARASLARFADAPTPANLNFIFHKSYAITPADLRKSILTLAVQGKLVDQLSSDEPANKLLERIRKTKGRLISERAIRRQDTDPIDESDAPFPAPKSWVWTRLGEIGDWGSGSTPARGNHDLYDGGIAWLKSGELNDNQALAGSEETVTELALKTGSFRRNQPGDVLLAMYGATIGKVAILAEPAVTNQAVCGCTPFDGVSNRYLFSFLLSQRARFHSASEGGAQPNISKVKIVGFPIPLPPLAEQKRIVAKLDELMALVDALETQLAASRATAANLLTALVAELTGTPNNGKVSIPSVSTNGRRGRPPKS
jgi:type I restriction enzyme S subunit